MENLLRFTYFLQGVDSTPQEQLPGWDTRCEQIARSRTPEEAIELLGTERYMLTQRLKQRARWMCADESEIPGLVLMEKQSKQGWQISPVQPTDTIREWEYPNPW